MKNASYNTYEVKKILENKLGLRFEGKPELKGWYKLKNKKVARVTVPKGRKFIPPKTYSSMARQLLLDVKQFDKLLDCYIKKNEYEDIISLKVII